MILGRIIEHVNTKCCLSIYLGLSGNTEEISGFMQLLENLVLEFPKFLFFVKKCHFSKIRLKTAASVSIREEASKI